MLRAGAYPARCFLYPYLFFFCTDFSPHGMSLTPLFIYLILFPWQQASLWAQWCVHSPPSLLPCSLLSQCRRPSEVVCPVVFTHYCKDPDQIEQVTHLNVLMTRIAQDHPKNAALLWYLGNITGLFHWREYELGEETGIRRNWGESLSTLLARTHWLLPSTAGTPPKPACHVHARMSTSLTSTMSLTLEDLTNMSCH